MDKLNSKLKANINTETDAQAKKQLQSIATGLTTVVNKIGYDGLDDGANNDELNSIVKQFLKHNFPLRFQWAYYPDLTFTVGLCDFQGFTHDRVVNTTNEIIMSLAEGGICEFYNPVLCDFTKWLSDAPLYPMSFVRVYVKTSDDDDDDDDDTPAEEQTFNLKLKQKIINIVNKPTTNKRQKT